tara:strand:+ start:243 stop:476 length:234 start_codon:yes stop_codon:yes gene_type:complete
MEMSKEKYEELMRRFSQELYEVGVTDDMKSLAQDSFTRTPNLAAYEGKDSVRKFHYRHNGYIIEAVRTITLTVKKCR